MSDSKQVVIIGSGPSGYTAAIYAGRASLSTVLFAGYQSGGQLMWTTEVENFPGFTQGVQGPELMMMMREQAARFGAEIRDEFVTAVDLSVAPFKIWTTLPDGVSPDTIERMTPEERQALDQSIRKSPPAVLAETVIISTGAGSIMLKVPGETEFLGKGVSTCAVCDAAFYKDKVTFVVGGGDSAMEDTLALTKFAKEVHVIHRRDSFKASKIMQDRVLKHPKVTVHWNSAVVKIEGQAAVESITIKDSVTGQTQTLPADGVFVAVGHRPVSYLFAGQVELDAHGYVVTRQSASAGGVAQAQAAVTDGLVAFPSMTSVDGVFAAGDVVDVRYKQAITAAGQGCAAALDAERWLEKSG